SLSAGVKGGKIEDALRVLLVEVERVRRHGFVAAELERARAEMLRRLERSAVEAATVDARQYARQIVRHHHDDRAMPGPAGSLALGQKFLPGITLAEVNALAEEWTQRKDRAVIATGPARDALPSEAALTKVVESIATIEVDPYQDAAAGALLAQLPKPGTIAERAEIPEVGVTVWTLSNGAKVVLKPTDFKNDEVLFSAFSNGGHSLAKDDRWESASRAAEIVVNGGVGEHDATALRKILAGKVAQMRPYIDELEEGLRGSASPRDVETMLQLAHLYFTAPRRDDDAFQAWMTTEREGIKNRDLNPQFSFFEAFSSFSAQGHARRKPASLARLAKVDQEQALGFYRERFADASDFTFVLVGNLDPAKIEPLVAQYIASLPGTKRKESWKDVGVRPPKGVKTFRMAKGQDPKSFVMLTFHGDAKWTPQTEHDLEMAESILDIRLREVLREDMSGVYGVFSNGRLERRPKQRYVVSIGFGCAPENADKLTKAVFDVVAAIKKDGIGEAEVTKLKEQTRRKLETRMRENGFWSEQLGRHFRYGTDPKQILELGKRVDRIDAAAVQKAMKRFVEPKRHLEGLLVPAADANAPAKPAATSTASTAATPAGKG
ncbi:MAG TPA: insulinase family protein, partial [Nannocystaceae bacterium]|nr:insulinase family protein [Nannocystaceae bacterium]